MTDNQYTAHVWLSRMWDFDSEINQLVMRRDKILDSLSGIGKYDDKAIPGGSDPNPTETKNIEYSLLSEQIDAKLMEIAKENVRTQAVINRVENNLLRGMLFAWYINRLDWRGVGKIYNYEKSRVYELRNKALDAVLPFIPIEEVNIDG